VKKQQLQAEAILLAYDLAKATGDTRISNQDFDAFIKTVKGNSVDATRKLLVRAGERVLSRYKATYTSVAKTYLPAWEATLESGEVEGNVTSTVNFYKEQLEAGGQYDPALLEATFKATADKYAPDAGPADLTTAGEDFDMDRTTLDDGTEVLRVTLKNGSVIDLKNPKYLDASKEVIATALSNMGKANN